jgi:hypothetical protein
MGSKHDDIMAAFRRYFEANQKWEVERTKRSSIQLRQSLSKIRELCSDQRVIVREWARIKEAELAEREAKRQAQKRQQAEGSNDN